VAARLDIDDRLSATEVEQAVADIEADLRRQFPVITELFLHVSAHTRDGGPDGQVDEVDQVDQVDQVAVSTPVASSTSNTPPTSTR
jgi:hypothetical protein